MGGGGLEQYMRMQMDENWMSIVTNKQLVFREMWGLVIVLLEYGSNNNTLSVYEKVVWTVYYSDHKFLPQRVLFAIKQFSDIER